MVIGSGPIVIGQAAEFDYAGTQACKALKEQGLEVVLVNSNPATLMTDNTMADAIYIEPLIPETVKRIIEKEKPDSLLSTLGGQTGLTLSMQLAKEGFLESHGVKLLGARPDTIDKAEDRQLFKDTMESIGEPCIPSKVVTGLQDALDFAAEISYPVIVRPAFTLGGTGGGIAATEAELREIAQNGLHRSPIHQILVEKCISGWKEIEFEVIRDGAGNVITVCSMENFDPVGVHTGDSIVIAPTARSPEIAWSLDVNTNDIAASVMFMVNGDMPSVMIGLSANGLNAEREKERCSVLLHPMRKETTYSADAPWDITVASAAPAASMPRPKMKIGSRTMFIAAPIITVSMLIVVFPCIEMKGLRPSVMRTNGVPARYIIRYLLPWTAVLSDAPKR